MLRSPTWGPSGVEIRITDFAGQGMAIPLRIGSKMDERDMRGDSLIASYNARSTVSGEPAVGRYAGVGVGTGWRAFRLSPFGTVV